MKLEDNFRSNWQFSMLQTPTSLLELEHLLPSFTEKIITTFCQLLRFHYSSMRFLIRSPVGSNVFSIIHSLPYVPQYVPNAFRVIRSLVRSSVHSLV